MKSCALGIIFMAAVIAAHAQQPQQPQQAPLAQPDDTQTEEGVAPNQQQIPTAQQDGARPNAPINWNHNHEVYPNTVQQKDNGDPTIDNRKCDSAPRPSAVQSAAHAVNPNDTNYGGILSQWHMQLVHDLLLSVEFWGLLCALVAMLLLLLYVLWLMRQRDQRLTVTVDIVLQLTNSRNFARYHNLRVIKIHNDFVERLNEQYERELRENGDGPREIDSATLPALPFLAPSGQSADSTSEQQTEASGSEQSQEVSSIPRSRLPANLASSLAPSSGQPGSRRRVQSSTVAARRLPSLTWILRWHVPMPQPRVSNQWQALTPKVTRVWRSRIAGWRLKYKRCSNTKLHSGTRSTNSGRQALLVKAITLGSLSDRSVHLIRFALVP